MTEKELKSIAENFDLEGTVVSVLPLGNGLINDTYIVRTAGHDTDYVLQRINNSIFKDVDLLQHNVMTIFGRNSPRKVSPTLTAGFCDLLQHVMEMVIISI